MGSPSAPPAPPPPQAPDYAAANREAIEADIETLGTRKRVEQAARLGRSVYDPDTNKTYDFTGLGDSELGREQAKVNAETADLTAQSILDIQRKYGGEFNKEALKRLEESDPEGFKARQDLAKQVREDLLLGSSLSPQAQRDVEEYVRGAQAARGNILGNAATAQETMAKFEVGEKLKQQRLANASGYVLGTPLTAQYQNISGAQNQAAPFQPTAYQPGMGLNPNAGAQGASFAQGIYGQQSANWNALNNYNANIYANTSNPWMQALGVVGGIGGSAAGAYFGRR